MSAPNIQSTQILQTVQTSTGDESNNVIFGQSGVVRVGGLSNIRSAIANVRNNSANATVLVLGDSVTSGTGALVGPLESNSYVALLADMLNNKLIRCRKDSFSGIHSDGTNGSLVALNTQDSRLNGTGLVAPSTAFGGYSRGNAFVATGVGTCTFAPGCKFDTVEIFHNIGSGWTTGSFDVDGTVIGTINSNNASYDFRRTILNVKRRTTASSVITGTFTGAFYLQGMNVYDSAEKSLNFIQCGRNSASSDTFINGDTGFPWGSGWPTDARPISVFDPDLVVMFIGINDISGAISTTAFKSNMQFIISKALNAGADVILLSPYLFSAQTITTCAPYINVLQSLAEVNNVSHIRLDDLFGPVASHPERYTDNLHLTSNGAGIIADALYRFIASNCYV